MDHNILIQQHGCIAALPRAFSMQQILQDEYFGNISYVLIAEGIAASKWEMDPFPFYIQYIRAEVIKTSAET